jgi:hypothetical protein
MDTPYSHGSRVSIYMNSKYAFTTIHVHGALYKGMGLINSGGKSVKYGQEILKFLEALWAPTWVAVMHHWGHQRGKMTIVWGSQEADWEVKWTAFIGGQKSASLTAAFFLCPLSEWDPWYTLQEQALFENEGGRNLWGRCWKFTYSHIAIQEYLAPTFVKPFHEGTHSGQKALKTTLTQHFYVPKLSSISKTVVCVPKTIPDNGQEHHPRYKVLEEQLL